MAYTFNKYYPTELVTDRTAANIYAAYKEFVQGNEILQRRFDVTYDDEGFLITLTPKEATIRSKPFCILVKDASSSSTTKIYVCGYCTALGSKYSTASSAARCYIDAIATNICVYIMETDTFFGINVGDGYIDDGEMQYAIASGGRYFDGGKANAAVFNYYYYYANNSTKRFCRAFDNSDSYLELTNAANRRVCTAASDAVYLTRYIDGGSNANIIFDDIYNIEGGTSLPACASVFRIGNDEFIRVFSNICVKVT
jgi:hypothetical protein